MATGRPGYSADRCRAHESCIVALIPRGAAGSELGGEWHLEWRAGARQWRLVSPTGSVIERDVRSTITEVNALLGAVDGRVFAPIATEIDRKGLFPP
jgi:hypothetical protein